MSYRPKSLLVVLAVATIGSAAYAIGNTHDASTITPSSVIAGNDAPAISQAQITLTQAINSAEKHANGKAVRAELENDRQGSVYAVEIINSTKVFDVRIDAEKGTVISSQEDMSDGHGKHHDHEHDGDHDD